MPSTIAPKLSPALLAESLKREPLVGVTKASQLLGIKASNFRRDAMPHLVSVPVEGSADVYFRSEVQQLAQDRAVAKAARRNGDG